MATLISKHDLELLENYLQPAGRIIDYPDDKPRNVWSAALDDRTLNHLLSIVDSLMDYCRRKGGNDLSDTYDTIKSNSIQVRGYVLTNYEIYLNMIFDYRKQYYD